MSLFRELLGDFADDSFDRDDGPTADRFPDDDAANRADEWDEAVHDWGWS